MMRQNGGSTNLTAAKAYLLVGGALLPFDDLALASSVAGGIGRSPAWLPLIAASMALKKVTPQPVIAAQRHLWQLWAYGCALTLMSLFFLPSVVRDEALVVKGLKLALILAIWILVFQTGWRAYIALPRYLSLAGGISFTIMAFILVLENADVGAIDAITLIHSTPNYAMRVRATRFEASSVGAGLLVAMALVLVTKSSKMGQLHRSCSLG
jgi:hypothetical protein